MTTLALPPPSRPWPNVIVDSLSSDATVAIAREFPNVRVVERAFDWHAAQWTFGAAQVKTDWVLTLDADYFVPGSFVRELASLSPPPDLGGYEAGFVYAVSVTYKGALYSSGMIRIDQNPQPIADISVYETTTDQSIVTVAA